MPIDDDSIDTVGEDSVLQKYTASLITQGKHRFYTLTMPSDVLADTCTVDTRIENPNDGFQRKLDKRRAEEIARYIDHGFGTIPCSIVLSAQRRADFQYTRKTRTVAFKKVRGAFLILDGQHRVFGFSLAKSKLRVPVVVYSDLSRADECRLFIDINTKQRPVPNELLLDIKALAETESDQEAFLRELFDQFQSEPDSPLFQQMSPAARVGGKISRVTFYAAIRSVLSTLTGSDVARAYEVLSAYLGACREGLRSAKAEKEFTNPTMFRALVLLFPEVAQRVNDRFSGSYTIDAFRSVLLPFFTKAKKSELRNPGGSYLELIDSFRKAFRQQFTIDG